MSWLDTNAQRIPALLVGMRFVGALAVTAGLTALHWLGQPPPVWLWPLPLAILGINLLLWLRLRHKATIGATELCIHLICDSGALLLVLWPTGGASNPFVSFFLVPVALGSVLLPRRHAIALTTLCIAAYTALLWHYLDSGATLQMHGDPGSFQRHVIGMWLNFVGAAVLLCVSLLALTRKLRQREQELAAHREQMLRDDAIMSMASLAAGAAHALNTPLGTIALAAESLQMETRLTTEAREDAATIAAQATLCGQHLHRIAAVAHQRETDTRTLSRFIEALMERWHARRADITTTVSGLENLPQLQLQLSDDPALTQALLNLFDNAADASRAAGHDDITAHWATTVQASGTSLALTIDDQGQAENIEALNHDLATTTKPTGLGLGLMLARASIYRLGGRLQLQQRADSGTRTTVQLPLTALQAPKTTAIGG